MYNIMFFFVLVGWSRDYQNEGFGEQSGIKSQLIALMTAVQTLLRSKLACSTLANESLIALMTAVQTLLRSKLACSTLANESL